MVQLAGPALVGGLVLTLTLGACFGGGPRLLDAEDAGSAGPVDFTDAAAPDVTTDVDLGDPFAILGLDPAHGPWNGGTRTVIRGRGFTSSLSIRIGGTEVDPSAIVASDPTRVAILTPAGAPGPADVVVTNTLGAASRTLTSGFFYDAFMVEPNSGAQTGGTRVRIEGRGTSFAPGTTVSFAGAPATDVKVVDATHLECTTPAGSLGPAEVDVQVPGSPVATARDAFSYTDLFDPSRGGLSGGALSGSLQVNVLDGATGIAIGGAQVIAGESLSGVRGVTAATGSVTLTDPSLTPKVTVTVAAKCHHPMTYVDVPVDTVTVYLAPVIDISCAKLQDPPSSGGQGYRNGGIVQGELIWSGGVEFKRGDWDNVPAPIGDSERRAAYVFFASSSTDSTFSLPAASSATTMDSPGSRGYGYQVVAPPGNVTVYAVAGLEDRSFTPPKFSAYAMGVARGVAVAPNAVTDTIDIPMNAVVDHTLGLASSPPPVTSRGPDRLFAKLAVSVGPNLYASLPGASKTELLPFPGILTFAPIPSLDGSLSGEAYVVGAVAATSDSQSAPGSVVAKVRVTDVNAPVTLGGFLPVPSLVTPGAGVFSGTHVEVGASGTYDMLEMVIDSGGGLATWTIVAPANRTTFDLPDLSALPDSVGLRHGAITTTVYVARLDSTFSYESVRSGDLASTKWTAYAWDALTGTY